MTALSPEFLDRLFAFLPPGSWSVDPSDLHEFGRDWTRVHTPAPALVVFPGSTPEVAGCLALCHEHRVSVVASGGRTGLSGGAVATNGEVVLSLSRMRRIDPVDPVAATVRVQAGAVTQAVHEQASRHGLTWPVSFASQGSSTIGGNIATNAGGVNVIRYGLTRQWVLGLEVVLADGRVLDLGGALEKNTTGIDLRQLFIGSEGILGVITDATLRLCAPPRTRRVMIMALDGLPRVLALLASIRQAALTVTAFEFFTEACVARLQRHRPRRLPWTQAASHYVLIETEAHPSPDAWAESQLESGDVIDAVMATSAAEVSELWSLREGISESLSSTGLPHKNDIAVPVSQLPSFCADLDALVKETYPGWELVLFGHVGDGNIHVNIMKPDDMTLDEFVAHTARGDAAVYSLVQRYRGSVSAEHGIGLLKTHALHYSRTREEIDLMRALKIVFDPRGILNPGKVIDARTMAVKT